MSSKLVGWFTVKKRTIESLRSVCDVSSRDVQPEDDDRPEEVEPWMRTGVSEDEFEESECGV